MELMCYKITTGSVLTIKPLHSARCGKVEARYGPSVLHYLAQVDLESPVKANVSDISLHRLGMIKPPGLQTSAPKGLLLRSSQGLEFSMTRNLFFITWLCSSCYDSILLSPAEQPFRHQSPANLPSAAAEFAPEARPRPLTNTPLARSSPGPDTARKTVVNRLPDSDYALSDNRSPPSRPIILRQTARGLRGCQEIPQPSRIFRAIALLPRLRPKTCTVCFVDTHAAPLPVFVYEALSPTMAETGKSPSEADTRTHHRQVPEITELVRAGILLRALYR